MHEPVEVFGGDGLGSMTLFVSLSGIDDEDEIKDDLHLSGVLDSLEFLTSLESLESLGSLDSLEFLTSLESLGSLGSLESLTPVIGC